MNTASAAGLLPATEHVMAHTFYAPTDAFDADTDTWRDMRSVSPRISHCSASPGNYLPVPYYPLEEDDLEDADA